MCDRKIKKKKVLGGRNCRSERKRKKKILIVTFPC